MAADQQEGVVLLVEAEDVATDQEALYLAGGLPLPAPGLEVIDPESEDLATEGLDVGQEQHAMDRIEGEGRLHVIGRPDPLAGEPGGRHPRPQAPRSLCHAAWPPPPPLR